MSVLLSGTALAQKYDGSGSPNFVPHTLQEALAAAYMTNPQLREERARLRATDEQMSIANAGWRPTIQSNVDLSYYDGRTNYITRNGLFTFNDERRYTTPGYNAGVTVTQPLYQGGKTSASIHQARNQILAERAQLIATEEQVFMNVVQAYIGVVEAEQLLQLNINNENVLRQQLLATQKRFQLGEISRTDVAQAQAALATALSQRQQAEGELQSAQASYLQTVGIAAPPNLIAPQPLVLPVKNERDAVAQAVQNNPAVVSALFSESQEKDNVSVQMAAIMPKVSAVLGYQHTVNQGYGGSLQDNKYGMVSFQIPVYQGGSEYANVRQARQTAQGARHEVDVQRRTALQTASSNWERMQAVKKAIDNDRAAISANVLALAGVERQALLGTSSTLAVLQQQQTLLQAQQALVQNLATLVMTSYNVAAAIGRLTAVDLKLAVPLYDEKAYYNAVKNRLWGISDYAMKQPGR